MPQRDYWFLLALAAIVGAGCDPAPELPTETLTQPQSSDNGLSINGLSINGLSSNGLSINGLSINGLSINGLSINGLSTSQFSSWFLGQSGGTAYTDMVMRYVVKCAAPAGASLSATVSGVTYTWAGELGLAPQWTAGNAIPLVEQQLISACLGAHVNKFGLQLHISVLGYMADGSPIPTSTQELNDYPIPEGCFFGNLFTGEGVFAGSDSQLQKDRSSTRACAISIKDQPNASCPPMVFVADCSSICSDRGDHNIYSSCIYNNTPYASLNTRIAQDLIYKCGDGICQASESCGTGKTADNCEDCGPCP